MLSKNISTHIRNRRLTLVCGLEAFGPGPPPMPTGNRRPKVPPHSHTEQQKGKSHRVNRKSHRANRKSHRVPPSRAKIPPSPTKIPPAKKGKLVSLLPSAGEIWLLVKQEIISIIISRPRPSVLRCGSGSGGQCPLSANEPTRRWAPTNLLSGLTCT